MSRSSAYYHPVAPLEREYRLLEAIDKIHTDKPFLGSRRIVDELEELELMANRKCVQRLMRLMGIEAMYPRPRTSRPGAGAGHRVFPYRLAGVSISRPNQVWAADVTFIPMPAGFAYLVAIMDVFSRKVLAWRLSNTQSARFCVDALQEAITLFGTPEIFNSDQGSQFTSSAFTSVLEAHGVTISMDGRGRWIDNVFTRALLALAQVRGGVPARVRRPHAGQARHRGVRALLQRQPEAREPRAQDA